MSVSLERPMSLEEFLAWEERQELRWEFDGFAPMAMTGGTAEHSIIERNLIFSLTGRLRGHPCQPYTCNLKIRRCRVDTISGRVRGMFDAVPVERLLLPSLLWYLKCSAQAPRALILVPRMRSIATHPRSSVT